MTKTLFTALKWIAIAFTIWVAAFFFWLLAMFACTDAGNTVGECRDNTLSRVVLYPINLIFFR